mgnify:CR=1 FL=1
MGGEKLKHEGGGRWEVGACVRAGSDPRQRVVAIGCGTAWSKSSPWKPRFSASSARFRLSNSSHRATSVTTASLFSSLSTVDQHAQGDDKSTAASTNGSPHMPQRPT